MTATFGVLSAGTFIGQPGIGSPSAFGGTADFTPVSSGTVTKITAGSFAYFGSSGTVAVAIYSDSGGVPSVKLAESATQTISGNGTFDFPISLAIVGGTPYWIAVWDEANQLGMNMGDAANSYIDGSASAPTWGSPFTTSFGPLNRTPVIYATYTVAAIGSLFRTPLLNGLGAGGPFFSNPIGRHRQPGNPQPWAKVNGIYRKAA